MIVVGWLVVGWLVLGAECWLMVAGCCMFMCVCRVLVISCLVCSVRYRSLSVGC